ncbi:hypothetical protein ABZ944_41145, partial [Streptomyces flaveolus]
MSDVAVSAEAVEEVQPTELPADLLDDQLIGQWSRILSRNARRSAVRPPPSGYRIPPAYRRDHEQSPP